MHVIVGRMTQITYNANSIELDRYTWFFTYNVKNSSVSNRMPTLYSSARRCKGLSSTLKLGGLVELLNCDWERVD
ncbi:hypothetical protein PIB30_072147, partial [Stylosanthes scabra]|nr:hypothetical protein [Stylosanthes scabra]